MKASKFIISTLRDAPNDAVIASHKLMMRSGMLRKLGNGLYAYMPLGFRSFKKLEQIIREELDKAGLLEMKPTVIQPGDLWKESGRWDKMHDEMLKAQNRQGQDMVVFLAIEDEYPVGFAQCGLRYDYVEGTKTSPVAYLEEIFVKEEYRKRGLAREMLEVCQKWVKEQKCSEFASDCELDNEDSLKFHKKMGFIEVNRIICFTKLLE